MGVHLDGFSGGEASRLEVIEGPTGRRRRTKAERARIASESLVLGASVTDAARRHGMTRWQVYDWRRKLRTRLMNQCAFIPVGLFIVTHRS